MPDREAGAARKQPTDAPSPRVSIAPLAAPAPPGRVAPAEADAFERRLTREILISERLRVTLLAVIPGLSMLLFLAASAVRPDLVEMTLHGQLDRLRVGLFLGGVSLYEFYSLYSVEKLIKSGHKPPTLRRYVNALVEMSMPTVVVLYYMAVVGPIDALLLPPSFTYFVFILLSTLRLDFTLCAFSGLVAAVEYVIVALVAVSTASSTGPADPALAAIPHHLGKAAILFTSGVAAGFVARRLRTSFVNTLRSIEDKNRIVGVFGQHVSPAVVERLIAAGADARSEVKEVTVMFVDIRNFTAFSEDKAPQEVVDYLNSLFDLMLEGINEHHGIVNKFLGDGFMAIFGAPLSEGNACKNAIEAALAIRARLDAEVKAGRLPPTRIGVGVHAGPVVIGNVGSRQRKEYTVIGDVVNVASRVEALNKEMGSQILVTEEVWKAGGVEGVLAVARAPLTVRGRRAPIQIYQLA
jgi:adenylate cyclase